jgi:hypothetical protein
MIIRIFIILPTNALWEKYIKGKGKKEKKEKKRKNGSIRLISFPCLCRGHQFDSFEHGSTSKKG